MVEYEFLHFPADAVQLDFRRFGRLPDSAQKVFSAVRAQGPLTAAQLRGATGMPPRTIRYAVRRLRDEGYLDTRCSLRDCRTCFFFVHRRCVGVAALGMEKTQRVERRTPGHQGQAAPSVRRPDGLPVLPLA